MEAEQGIWHSLSELMHSIKSFSAKSINQLRGTTGPVLQDEYFDRTIRDENEFVEKWDYILNNPIKSQLADKPGQYPYHAFGQLVDRQDACPTADKTMAARNTKDSWEGKLKFYPARYAKNFENWHLNIRDWCISRQLWWGHRIPV